MKTEKFDVVGMSCAACAAHIEKEVGKLEGVKKVNVNLLTNSMVVDFEESNVDTDKIEEAVVEAGYEAHVKSSAEQAASRETKKNRFCSKRTTGNAETLVDYFRFLVTVTVFVYGFHAGLVYTGFFQGRRKCNGFCFYAVFVDSSHCNVERKVFQKRFQNAF